jgi:hypothetical protein
MVRSIFSRLKLQLSRIDPFDLFSVLLLAGLVAVALATFEQYGISNDEAVQQRYGELIIAYYASGFTDQSLFHFDNLYLYGGLFDIAAVLLERAVPLEPFFVRHILCAMIGIVGIGATCATARLIAGPRAGLFAAVGLALCGPFYGAMFNHTKDIPFAAFMMAATYLLLRASRDLPRPRLRHVLGFGVMLGAALGMRVTGLLLVGYIAAAIVLHLPRGAHGNLRSNAAFAGRALLRFAPAFVLGYLIMIAAWPWAALAPLNPIRGASTFASFHYAIRTLLAGHVYTMAEAPRWYVPAYLAIKLPLQLLLGVALAGCAAALRWRQDTNGVSQREVALLAVAGFLPLLCQAVFHGPSFTGLRHFLFVVPPLAALAGIGLHAALSQVEARRPVAAFAAATALVAGFLWNASVLIRLHPDQYLFFNPLVGGLEGASRRYDTDYWVNIMPEAVDDLAVFLDRAERDSKRAPRTFTVGVCGERLSFEKEADPRLQWIKDWRRADFFIAPTHMDCDKALDGKVIATIERLGVPIGVVKDRRAITRPGVAENR